MPQIAVYNSEGKEVRTLDLPAFFGMTPKAAVLHQVYVAEMANRRTVLAHTKNRGEVRGGGKKPWRQKGTGRARHGSIRSPIWRHGGVTFGPRSNRNFEQKINKKMKNAAVRMALAGKCADGQLVVVETFGLSEPKTKLYAAFLNKLPSKGRTTLVMPKVMDRTITRSMRNIPKTDIMPVGSLNVVELLHHQFVITTPEAIETLAKRLA